MTPARGRARTVRKLLALGVLALDLALFLGPRTGGLALLEIGEQVPTHVFMFRTQDPECAYGGPDANYNRFWLPQWDCTPTETARYALFATALLCATAVIVAPKRIDLSAATWALLGAQAIATAMALLECGIDNAVGAILWLAWIPALFGVAVARTSVAWRKRMVIAAAISVVAACACTAVRLRLEPAYATLPRWRGDARGMSAVVGTGWFAVQFLVLPLPAVALRLAFRPAAGAPVRRVATAAGGVALAASGIALAAQWLAGPARFVELYGNVLARIATALAFAALAAVWPDRSESTGRLA